MLTFLRLVKAHLVGVSPLVKFSSNGVDGLEDRFFRCALREFSEGIEIVRVDNLLEEKLTDGCGGILKELVPQWQS